MIGNNSLPVLPAGDLRPAGGDPFGAGPICVRCSFVQDTCCETSEVYVTPGDVRRITTHTGKNGFYEFRVPEDPVYLKHDDDPLWKSRVFRPDGTRRVLRREPGGACTFLGELGCRLPADVRPLLCRLYPYDFNEREILPMLARGCPLELVRPGGHLLGELDMRIEDAQAWHRQLYEEIRDEDRL